MDARCIRHFGGGRWRRAASGSRTRSPRARRAHVVLQRSDDNGATWQSPVRVNAVAEPVSAEGENRPKLAFGTAGEIYVTWTSPTSAQFTGDIRFARSLDGGKTWSAPTVVHRDRQLITHRFESLLVDAKGRLWVAWVDKRDLKAAEAAGRAYAGAAIYYAHSDDRGATWSGDTKLADSSCECCRIALASRQPGTRRSDVEARVRAERARPRVRVPRHARKPRSNARRSIAGASTRVRITARRSRSGPTARGTRSGSIRSTARVARSTDNSRSGGPSNVQTLPAGATHADLAVAGRNVAVAWKRFDGSVTKIESLISNDAGRSFRARAVAANGGRLGSAASRERGRAHSGRLAQRGRHRGRSDARSSAAARLRKIKPFGRDTLAAIERAACAQRSSGSCCGISNARTA